MADPAPRSATPLGASRPASENNTPARQASANAQLPAGVAPPAGVTQLEFHQAMRDFKTMFPDMDTDVIEAVLRANNGTVDTTIDQLLAMTTDVENEKLRTELESRENTEVPPRYSSPGTKPLCEIRHWKPPLLGPLPNTFLRLDKGPSQVESSSSTRSVADTELAQFLEDEKMAMFLQNEEFVLELRRNKEFMSTLDSKAGEGVPEDDTAFRERLKRMGKASRRKFAQMAHLFSRNAPGKRGNFRHPPSRDDLLLTEDDHLSDNEDAESDSSRRRMAESRANP